MKQVCVVVDLLLSYIDNMMNYIGHLIINSKNKTGALDVESVVRILKDIENNLDKKHKDMLVSAMFDFITPEGYTIASTIHGKITPPRKVESKEREYIGFSKKNPWELCVCKPDIGTIAEERIIPLSIGITDSDNNFAGYVTSGINVNKFKKKLSQVIQSEHYSFIVLNSSLEYILYSGKEEAFNEEDKIRLNNDLKYLKRKKSTFGTLKETIFADGTEYMFYVKTNNYPFIIIIGIKRRDIFDIEHLKKEIVRLEKKEKYDQVFLLSLLFLFQTKIINPIVGERNALPTGFSVPKVFSTHVNDLFLSLEQMEGFMALKIQNEITEALSREKERLLHAVLHDLRNPLSVINQSIDLMRSKVLATEDTCEMIKNSVVKIENIANSLLLVAKMESDELELNRENVDLVVLIDDVVESFLYEARIINTKLTKKITAKNTKAFVDKQIILRVLTNLVSNSVKFTSNGKITLILEDGSTNNELVLRVVDTGTGISKKELKRVTEEFRQGKHANTHQGTGLGLSIVKKFIELHGGKVGITSELGRGTEVRITLPILK